MVCIIAVQRAIQKILIAVFLSREFKHDETNIAWWSGKWYGRGLGSSALSQPAREFVVKIVEMSLWSSDFLLGHILLIVLTPPIFIPFIDRLHSTMLCKFLPLAKSDMSLFNSVRDRLAPTFETDTSPSVLHEAETSTSLDSTSSSSSLHASDTNLLLDREVYLVVYYHDLYSRGSDRPSYVFVSIVTLSEAHDHL